GGTPPGPVPLIDAKGVGVDGDAGAGALGDREGSSDGEGGSDIASGVIGCQPIQRAAEARKADREQQPTQGQRDRQFGERKPPLHRVQNGPYRRESVTDFVRRKAGKRGVCDLTRPAWKRYVEASTDVATRARLLPCIAHGNGPAGAETGDCLLMVDAVVRPHSLPHAVFLERATMHPPTSAAVRQGQ